MRTITRKKTELGSTHAGPPIPFVSRISCLTLFSILVLVGCGSSSNNNRPVVQNPAPEPAPAPAPAPKTFNAIIGNDTNSQLNSLLSLNEGGPGGSPNQSLRAGDVLVGGDDDDVIVGGLGVDILIGNGGDDILIGGTEDFNSSVDGDNRGSDNRDRAYGQAGDDVFIWAPGDGSDLFDGGEGTDVLIFGVLGEARDATGNTDGAPFFAVNPPGSEGSQDHDGIQLDENSQPSVRASNSPGFCTLLDVTENGDALSQLDLDLVVRFSLRGIADAFDAGERTDDDGLRVAVSVKNTEFVVCTRRDFDADLALENIEVFDISGDQPVEADINALPEYVQGLIF
ncbi:MAG: hypothetical protein AB8B81_05410 [Halioglobus sp.]